MEFFFSFSLTVKLVWTRIQIDTSGISTWYDFSDARIIKSEGKEKLTGVLQTD